MQRNLHPQGSPLVYSTFACHDRDAASEQLTKIYGSAPIKWALPTNGSFRFGLDIATIGRTTLVRGNFSSLITEREIDGSIQFIVPLRGHYEIITRGRPEVLASVEGHTIGVLRPTMKTVKKANDCVGICANVSLEDVTERLRTIAGSRYRPGMTADLVGSIDSRTVVGQILARRVIAAFDECRLLSATGNGELATPLLEDDLLNIVAVAAFAATEDICGSSTSSVSPEVVRRVRAHIEEHYDGPLAISDLCGMFDISLRALQDNFRRYFGTTPKEFLTDCGLAHARRALEAGTASSVTAVAIESGFSDLSIFAAKYKLKFKEAPSETLRRTRVH
jgi:AraC-like DNA-binding protein